MKKMLLYIGIFLSLLIINTYALDNDNNLILNDVSTLNIREKLNNIDIHTIKKICTYDFCENIDGTNLIASIKRYTNKYLDTINDEEIKNELKVKGIKITKVVLNS